ncbi:MAG: NTP/NDP exchange transporter [Chlamydiia bacterium]
MRSQKTTSGGGRLLSAMQWLCQWNFGRFDRDEFKKFLRMGLIFTLIIGVYWTLRPLKDAVFIHLVDKLHLPYAKTVSVLALLPIVVLYTRLLEKTSRERMFSIMSWFYGLTILAFAVCMFFAQGSAEEVADRQGLVSWATTALGYVWYVFVESFGSLVVALFWAFASDTTVPDSAKRGFPFVVALGQIGGIICPYFIGGLPHRLGLSSDALSMVILGGMTLSIAPCVKNFLHKTPKEQLVAFHGKNEIAVEKKQEPGFFEGFRLLISQKYLLGIFAAIFIYEVIVTIFDFNFKITAGLQYSGVALSSYLSWYGSCVNAVSLACLLLGISNITRFMGVGIALALMPLIVAGALVGFLTTDTLEFLFILMVGSKAINYALNGPALKQLYIPTTPDVRFKAQAWIETFGSRASKEAGSIFNMALKPLQSILGPVAGRAQYLMLSGYLGFGLVALWFVTAIFLGRTFRKAVDNKKVVC